MTADTTDTTDADRTDGDARLTALDGPTARRLRRFAAQFRQSRLAVVGGAVLVVYAVLAVLAPEIAPHDPTEFHIRHRLEPPSATFPFGTDKYGRDIFSRVLVGSRVAMKVALAVPLVAASVGVPVGLVAGYFGGRLDNALMRVMDAIFAFPAILLGLTIVAVFGQSLTNIILALGVVFIPQFARVTRGSAVSAVEEEHVKAAKSLGASHPRVLGFHVFPFCVSAILVQASITAALAIIVAASLSFLGVGVQPPKPSWGVILRNGKGFIGSAWWYSVFPGLAIITCVLGFNLLGDGLRDVLDPRSDTER